LFVTADGKRLDRHGAAARVVRRVTRRAGIAKHVSPDTRLTRTRGRATVVTRRYLDRSHYTTPGSAHAVLAHRHKASRAMTRAFSPIWRLPDLPGMAGGGVHIWLFWAWPPGRACARLNRRRRGFRKTPG
jgi:hypothetical protein